MITRLEFPRHILFAWWNTGLSSVRGQKKNRHAKIEIAQQVIRSLICDGIDFIALAEVDDEDIRQLHRSILSDEFDYIRGTVRTGKTRFDLGVLYNTQKIVVQEHEYVVEKWAESNIVKLALRVDMLPHLGHLPFTVFVLHWPSLLRPAENREQYGTYLRRHINQSFSCSQREIAYIITMGDFNYEPFDKTLTDGLWATRDRVIASRKQSFLYNPFWRRLGEHTDFSKDSNIRDDLCGTHFYEPGKITRWRTYDQMMFSSDFLTSGEWYLDEKYSIIWQNEFFNFRSLRKYGFDHFPIISAVEFTSKSEGGRV